MKKLYVLFFVMFVAFSTNAQQMHITKTTVIGGNKACIKQVLQSTTDGGVFWTGATEDSTGIGDIPLCSPRNDKSKMMVGKIDSNGNNEWVKVYCDWNYQPSVGCPSLDNGYAIASFNVDTPDIYFTKIDCEGKVQWQKRWGSSNLDGTQKVIQNKDSSYIILGGTIGDDGDIPFNYTPPNSSIYYGDIVLIKTDKNGNKQWLKIYGSSTDDGSKLIYLVGDYYYIIAHTDGLSNDHDFSDTNSYPGNSKCYLMKIDSLGTIVWSRSIGNLNVTDAIFDEADSTFMCVSGTGINLPPINDGNTQSDYGVVKVNLEGLVVWAKHYGDSAYKDIPTGICKGPSNSYLILGQTFSEQFNAQPPRIGYLDGLIYWIDSTGNEIEHKFYGSTLAESPEKIIGLNYNKKFLITSVGGLYNNPYTEGSWLYGTGVIAGPTFSVLEIGPTAVTEIPNSVAGSLKVYPNPADNKIAIELNGGAKGSLRITDITGKLVWEKDVKQNENSWNINTQGWQRGSYIIQWIEESGKEESRKLLLR